MRARAAVTLPVVRALYPFVFGLAAAACSGPPTSPSSSRTMRLPNIVILYADDLGYGDVGCYNPDSKIPTPHLDRLAIQGMRFTDAHSSSGICTPSRYALLTGKYNWRGGVNGISHNYGSSDLPRAADTTLAEFLKTQGYDTAAFGKWHLGGSWFYKDGSRVSGNPEDQSTIDSIDWTRPVEHHAVANGFDYFRGLGCSINFGPFLILKDDRISGFEQRICHSRPLAYDARAHRFKAIHRLVVTVLEQALDLDGAGKHLFPIRSLWPFFAHVAVALAVATAVVTRVGGAVAATHGHCGDLLSHAISWGATFWLSIPTPRGQDRNSPAPVTLISHESICELRRGRADIAGREDALKLPLTLQPRHAADQVALVSATLGSRPTKTRIGQT